MARNRFIKPGMLIDPGLASLPLRARYTFTWILTYVDDKGRGLDIAGAVKAHVYPTDNEVSADDVADDLNAIAAIGAIERWTAADGRPLLRIRGFIKSDTAWNQVINRSSPPLYPASPEELTALLTEPVRDELIVEEKTKQKERVEKKNGDTVLDFRPSPQETPSLPLNERASLRVDYDPKLEINAVMARLVKTHGEAKVAALISDFENDKTRFQYARHLAEEADQRLGKSTGRPAITHDQCGCGGGGLVIGPNGETLNDDGDAWGFCPGDAAQKTAAAV